MWYNGTLSDHAYTVHMLRRILFYAMPMNRGRFKRIKHVFNINSYLIVLTNLDFLKQCIVLEKFFKTDISTGPGSILLTTLIGRVNPFADIHLERKQSLLFIVQFKQSLDNTMNHSTVKL